MHVTNFEAKHLLLMDIQPRQAWMRDAAETDYGAALAAGVAQTVWDGETPIACFGQALIWHGTAEVWSVFARDIGTRMTYVYRATRRLIESVDTRRLQAFVDADFAEGVRWMLKLGFRVEGKPAGYFPNGNDAFLFAHVRGAASVPQMVPFASVDAYEERNALERVLRLEREIGCLPSQIHLEAVHHFSRGLYARELTIPKGATCTGKMHRHDHISVVTKGDISVFTGDGVKRYRKGDILFCKAGTKRAVFAHEETTWTTIHGTRETDLERLEAELVVPPEEFVSMIAEAK